MCSSDLFPSHDNSAVQNKKALEWQKEQWQQQMQYGREMWEKQNEAEDNRMALQNQWNKEAAAQSQQYAKEMFDYTGYENQVKQMKAAGLNPALMNGGGGSAGQASAGAEVQPAQAFQPMGIQMALQAQQEPSMPPNVQHHTENPVRR